MEIRLAGIDDIPAIRAVIIRNFDEVIAKDHSAEIVEKFKAHNSEDALIKQLSWKRIYVAEENGAIVATGAFANLSESGEARYCISNLYVLPNCQKRGIGSALVTKLFKDFRRMRAPSFHVPSTRGAVGFYQKFGFTVDPVQNDTADEITWMTYKPVGDK